MAKKDIHATLDPLERTRQPVRAATGRCSDVMNPTASGAASPLRARDNR